VPQRQQCAFPVFIIKLGGSGGQVIASITHCFAED
jgi:hypothetical protein